MARVNVFLPNELLRAVETEARRAQLKRSALVQIALTEFLERRREAQEQAARQREMADAARGMDVLAEKLGAWDPVRVIREFRDRAPVVVAEKGARYGAGREKKRS